MSDVGCRQSTGHELPPTSRDPGHVSTPRSVPLARGDAAGEVDRAACITGATQRCPFCRWHQFLELEVDAKGIVQLGHLTTGDPADNWPQALHGHRVDLFPLRL